MAPEPQPGRGQSGRGASNVAAGFKIDNTSVKKLVDLWKDLNKEVKAFNAELAKIDGKKLDALGAGRGGKGAGGKGGSTVTAGSFSNEPGDGSGRGGGGQASPEERGGGGFHLSRAQKIGIGVGGAAIAYGASKMENWVNADRLSQYTAWGTPFDRGSAGSQMGAARHFWFGGQGNRGLTGFTSTSDALMGLQMVDQSAGMLSMTSRSRAAQQAAGRAGNILGDMTTGATGMLQMRTPQMYYGMQAIGVQTSRNGQRAAPESIAQQFLRSIYRGRMPTAQEVSEGMEVGAPLRVSMEQAGLGAEAQQYIARYGQMADRLRNQRGREISTRDMIKEMSRTGGRSEDARDAFGSTVYDSQRRREQTRARTEQELADGALPALRTSIDRTTDAFNQLNRALGFGGIGNVAGGAFGLGAGPGQAVQGFMGSAMGNLAFMALMSRGGRLPGGIGGAGRAAGGMGPNMLGNPNLVRGGGVRGVLRSAGGRAGAAGLAGMVASNLGGSQGTRGEAIGDIAGGALTGAGIGAMLAGIPTLGIGAPVGAAAGGLLGGIVGGLSNGLDFGLGGASEAISVSQEEASLVSGAWGKSMASALGDSQDSALTGPRALTDGTGTDIDMTGASATATSRGKAALAWMQRQHNSPTQSWLRKCLSAVRQALGVPGGVYDALTSWSQTKKRRGKSTPPPGVPVWWGGGPNGHVALSAGGGMVWSNDIRSKGKIDLVPIDEITSKWGKPYYGWTEDINGVDVYDPKASPTQQSARASVSGSTLTQQDVFKLARDAGFDRAAAVIMTAIAGAESGYKPGNHNPNANTGDNSYGLWQINMLGKMGPDRRRAFGIRSNEQLFDPRTNARAARMIFGWQGLGAWSAYKNGSYRQYLKGAQSAADALPKYDIGAYNVGSDHVAVVHEGEMILPRKQAQRIRDYVRRQQMANTTGGTVVAGAGGGSRSVTVHLSMPIQTVTGISAADAKRLVGMVARQLETDERIASVIGGD